jgi:hypothetical protein
MACPLAESFDAEGVSESNVNPDATPTDSDQ